MNTICVKLRMRKHENKYRKLLSTEEAVYPTLAELVESSLDYAAGAMLENGEWFKITNASQQPYTIDLLEGNFESVDFDSLARSDFRKIDYLFVKNGKTMYFQNVSQSKLASKKRIGSFGESYKYESDSEEIVINEYPDAVYCAETNILYFRKLEPIVGIFKGINDLYREATDDETEQFLQNDFITLKDDYGTADVKTANRKRIALTSKTLLGLSQEDRSNIFHYIGEYCPDLKTKDNTFCVGNEDELKMVLFGIEQRFYTTPVGGEKRIANSVILLNR
ncbi:ATP F0F1 synthase synthase [Ihubacter sp. mB4P-1]|uniref:ATP F0F1 synthase synthase n=1 Tax=Ihubacter sp. mB4P-1 TaxID=3242370 RepID=UPI003C7DE656